MLPKQEVQDIKLQIHNGLLGITQYEFICLRLIDTIKQLEEQKEKLMEENESLRESNRIVVDELNKGWEGY